MKQTDETAFIEKLLHEVDEITGINDDTSRDRPYDGQAHTDAGTRGKKPVKGLTMRDVCDCMAMGLLDASCIETLQESVDKGTWTYNDLYQLEDFDPVAAIQCMACRMEEMMGIYPNVQGMKGNK